METAIELLFTLYREIRYSLNQRFELELVMSRLAGMRSYLSPKEVLHQIGKLRSELVEGKLPLGQQQVAGSDNDVPETEPPRSPQIREHAPPKNRFLKPPTNRSHRRHRTLFMKSRIPTRYHPKKARKPPKNSHAVVGQTEQAEGPRNLSQEEIQQTIDSLRKQSLPWFRH